ncbi:hypothetical protein TNCV_2422951 [Trichonephila clavipes]|nr:hypothetical protein TNCV_2422951 [Trichonephila clavipes]
MFYSKYYSYFPALVEKAVTPNSPEQNQIAKQVSPKTPDSHVDGGPVTIVTDAFLEGEGSLETIARATDLFEILLSPYLLIPNPIANTIYNSLKWPLGESATPGSQTKEQNELAPGPGEEDIWMRYCLAQREPQKFS